MMRFLEDSAAAIQLPTGRWQGRAAIVGLSPTRPGRPPGLERGRFEISGHRASLRRDSAVLSTLFHLSSLCDFSLYDFVSTSFSMSVSLTFGLF